MPIPTLLLPLLYLGAQASEPSITLRYQPPVGNRYVYAMKNDMSMKSPEMPEDMTMALNATQIVRVSGRTGDITKLTTSIVGASFTAPSMEGMPPQQQQAVGKQMSQSLVSQIGRLGDTLPSTEKSASPMGAIMPLDSLGGFSLFSENAVKVGDTWSAEADMAASMKKSMQAPFDISGGKFPVNIKLTGIEWKGGIKVANLSIDTTGTLTIYPPAEAGETGEIDMTITMHSDIVIDVATGVQLENTTKGSIKMVVGAVTVMEQQMNMSLKLKS